MDLTAGRSGIQIHRFLFWRVLWHVTKLIFTPNANNTRYKVWWRTECATQHYQWRVLNIWMCGECYHIKAFQVAKRTKNALHLLASNKGWYQVTARFIINLLTNNSLNLINIDIRNLKSSKEEFYMIWKTLFWEFTYESNVLFIKYFLYEYFSV